ncbi:hypothetical protein B6V73_18410 [Thioclava sp. JM3]|uniref:DUF2189 domain-containing protein n=1 Tax=Thioclava nitratireducens TaxID=1915078 RepID=A0ABM6IP63_9RHOB|nr:MULTISPECIES: DUF2189 domain-containing protein [Thioclava]AQS50170.1 hypothetical protein BMG03_19910 [Thioclava nitratireducens]OWY08459.1 hypothetical protein B6V72_18455 [Thioclava sp. F34-6]OWY12449.1 hypothetical protein B6V73_18410 [Thioclava sp. JM3]PWE48953.1 DUF2189 domain-containing protein [Thioclava sp. NG1]
MLEPLPTLRNPDRPASPHARNLPSTSAADWLRAGWRDVRKAPWSSLAYGLFLTLVSYAVLWALNASHLLYLALPAISGFLIVGPFLAIGLYEKSHRQAQGEQVSLSDMLVFRPASGGQLAYAGLLLGLLVLFWLRAADLLYALFFGLSPFPGAEEALTNALTTPRGWALVITGTLVGGLFAAFAFAISVFSIPMLVSRKTDALTAMGLSFVMAVQNLRPMLVWGLFVALGLGLSVVTGLIGLIVLFPVLGHGTWHAYQAIAGERQ